MGDPLRLGPEEIDQVVDGLLELSQRQRVLEITEVLAKDRLSVTDHSNGVFHLSADTKPRCAIATRQGQRPRHIPACPSQR